MIIKKIELDNIKIPLHTPFKTAVRTATSIDDVIIKIITDDGIVGFGEVPPTALITGDTTSSIYSVINDFIAPKLIGMSIYDMDAIKNLIKKSVLHNTAAKAGAEIAIYDLYSKYLHIPLYKLLGNNKNSITTDITISLNDIDTMVKDSVNATKRGFNILKVKIGNDYLTDIKRIQEIRNAVGKDTVIRVDANQGFTKKQAVKVIRAFEDLNLFVELVEQPVKADDLEGLKYVTDNVLTDILADEAVFSLKDAVDIIYNRRADLINIKLMKTGGISDALSIANLAAEYNVKCMMGCMLEGAVGIIAALHVACSHSNINIADLDGLGLASYNPIIGGVIEQGDKLILTDEIGLGIKNIRFE